MPSQGVLRVSRILRSISVAAARQTLPGYDLFIELDNTRELLRVVPRRLSTGTVDVVWKLSADQAHALSADQAQDYPPIRRINRG
jgi:hypothetical protein